MRDAVAVSALRTALAAIDNAEAVPPDEADLLASGGPVAGSVAGLGASDVRRRDLTGADVERIVRAEAAERLAAAGEYERRGQPDRAARLRAEASVLSSYLS